jgi:phosphohistidine phosphatase
MDLILWRHADAEDGYPDAKRMLTPKGRKQAARMAQWLEQHLPSGYVVLASPALRTQETAAALGGKVTTREELGLSATADSILRAAGWPDCRHAVVVVGHQPTLGITAATLLAGNDAQWNVRKGAIWWLASEDGRTVLRAMLSPDLL